MPERSLAVVILAAGRGTRMKSGLPKALHQIAGQAMVSYVAETVKVLNPAKSVLVVGSGMEEVVELCPWATPVMQDPPLGTADAVQAAFSALDGFAGSVLILCADIPLVSAFTLKRLLASHSKFPLAVLAMRPEEPGAYGRIVKGPDGDLEAIVEASDATQAERDISLCNSGIMVADADVLAALIDSVKNENAQGEYYLTDIVALARAKECDCAVTEGPAEELMGINSRLDLAVAEALMQTRLRKRAMEGGATLIDPGSVTFAFDTRLGRDVVIEPNVVFGTGVKVGKGVFIRSFSHIEGAHIAGGAVIGPFARLRPNAKIGQKARVGNFVEIKKSVIGKEAKVNHLTYIGDARIGAGANVGAGTITCNYDGIEKSETKVGAGALIGSNSSLVAPVKVGSGAVIGAGSVISRDVASDALSLSRPEQIEVKGWAKRRHMNTSAVASVSKPGKAQKDMAGREGKISKSTQRASEDAS